ncbi:hypothetical protein ACM66B_002247 [Microbotryomycetes sp. NB124-2]
MRPGKGSSTRSNTTLSSSSSSSSSRSSGLPLAESRHAAHDKLKLKLTLSRQPQDAWLAGEIVTGTLELAVSSSELELGELGIEFAGYEELRLRDHTSTRRLLSARVDFQGGSLPPSNATIPDAQQKHAGFWPALRGRTRFPFSFRLPKDAPSSCSLGGNATTRYELRAFVSSILEENVDVRSEKMAVHIVERWADWDSGEWNEPIERKAAERLKVGADGYVSMAVAVGKDDWSETPLRLFWAGNADLGWHGKNQIELRARIQNLSKRHVSGLKVTLCRCLRRIYPKDVEPPRREVKVVATVMTQQFHGVGFEFPPGEEREVHAQFLVPQEECWTKRRGQLFELDTYVRVEMDSNMFANDFAVELPVFVAHPASLPPAAHDLIEQRLQFLAAGPSLPPQNSCRPDAQLLHGYRDPYTRSIVDDFAEHSLPQHQWTSETHVSLNLPQAPERPLHRTASTSSLAYASTSYAPTPGPVMWAPASLSRQGSAYWPASPFVQVVPQARFVAPPAAPVFAAPPQAPVFTAPPPAPSPAQHFARTETASPTRRSPLPARPDSGQSVHSGVAHSFVGQPLPPTSPSPVPMHRSNSSSSLKSHKKSQTPPPASPSSRFSPVSAVAESVIGVTETGLLETIGEDGESQAGTARSVAREVTQALAVIPSSPSQDNAPFPSPKGRIESRNSAQDLEDLVEQEDKAAEERRKDQVELHDTPKSVPRAQDIFASTESDHNKGVEPPNSPSRGLFVRSEGGLAALEARLSRPTTPAASSPSLSSASASAAPASPRQQKVQQDATVLSLSDKLASLKMQPTPVVREEITRVSEEKQDLDDILDSYGSDEQEQTEGTSQVEPYAPISKPRPVFRTQRKPVPVVEETRRVIEVQDGRKVVNKAEIKNLTLEAVSRVSDWLKDEDTDGVADGAEIAARASDGNGASAASQSVEKISKSPWTSAGRSRESSRANGPSAGPPFTASQTPASSSTRHKSTRSEPVVPTAHELGSKKIEEDDKLWERAGKGLLRASPSGDLASLKYDIRSARGGKGGVVSKVASQWTTLIDEEQREANKPPPPRIEPPKALKIASALFEAPKTTAAAPLSPLNNLRSSKRNSMPVSQSQLGASSAQATGGPSSIPTSKSQTLLSGPFLQASPSSMMRTSVSASSISSDKGGEIKAETVTMNAPLKRLSSSGSKVKELMAKYAKNVEAQ